MTDNEIIKALYDYKNSNLIQVGNGKVISISDIIDLINRLQAENERLKEENKILDLNRRMAWKEKEVVYEIIKTAKAEAYKEFAEQIFELFPADKCNTVISRVTVKHILKEKVGE